jgi:hypothetical protein
VLAGLRAGEAELREARLGQLGAPLSRKSPGVLRDPECRSRNRLALFGIMLGSFASERLIDMAASGPTLAFRPRRTAGWGKPARFIKEASRAGTEILLRYIASILSFRAMD